MCFYTITNLYMSFLGGSVGKESAFRRHGFDSWVGKIPWSRKWQPTPLFLPGVFHGQRSLSAYSPWGPKELDMTELLSTHYWGFPRSSVSKESACNAGPGFHPWVGHISWRRKWQPAPVFLPGKFHGQRSLAGYSS